MSKVGWASIGFGVFLLSGCFGGDQPSDVEAVEGPVRTGAQCHTAGNCAAMAHATVTCRNQRCDYICNTGFKQCGNACISAASCCTNADCAAPETCGGGGVAGKCSCPTNSQLCTGSGARSCVLTNWTFEAPDPVDQTHVQGWFDFAANNAAPQGSTLHPHTGAWAIFSGNANNPGQMTGVSRFACDNGGLMDIRGRTFTASVFLTSAPAGNLTGTSCSLHASTGPTATPANPTPFTAVVISGGIKSPLVQGAYFTLTGTFPNTAPASEVYVINVECLLPSDFDVAQSLDTMGASSSFYVDDVSIR